ncbi:50S ribosomal protein L5 [Patescibacteria group bacterium]|nr:50S ribosomal protein L5 [Patescibacteria group bacterium]
MNRLKQKYQQDVAPALKKEFKIDNSFALPKVEKVVINMGITDQQNREKAIESVVEQFKVITGMKPNVTRARKSIATFKTRAGDPLGVMVTLRGEYMWEFLDKLISLALPRVKDFQGVSRTAFDEKGNYNLGIEEQIVFPEINYDTIESIRGLQITIVAKTADKEKAFRMLELLGMPFAKEKK